MTSTERLNQQLKDSIAIKIPNPRGLPDRLVSIIVSADRCPMCLGDLDTAWECKECGYDAKPWIKQSTAKNDRAWDNREA
jgi:hypothetical protein